MSNAIEQIYSWEYTKEVWFPASLTNNVVSISDNYNLQ